MPGGGLELFCLLSFSFEFVPNPSLSHCPLCAQPPLSVHLSVSGEGGKREGVPCPRPWGSISLPSLLLPPVP